MPAPAEATPPTLLAVGHTQRHITASWSLPPGAQSRVIEAATSPATGSDGYFFQENVKAFSTLEDAQTSYVDTTQTDAGFYYVHVASFQSGCVSCPTREWSNILTLTIPPDPPPPPPPPAPDTDKPFSLLGGPSKQDIDKLYVTVQASEAGSVTARGTVNVPRLSRVYRFKSVTRAAKANVPVKLRLKLSARSKRAAKRALKRGRRLRARVTVIASDKAGNATTSRRSIRLKR